MGKMKNVGLIGLVSAMPLLSGCLAAALVYSAETVAESRVEAARIAAGQSQSQRVSLGNGPLEKLDLWRTTWPNGWEETGTLLTYEQGIYYTSKNGQTWFSIPYPFIDSFNQGQGKLKHFVTIHRHDDIQLREITFVFKNGGEYIFIERLKEEEMKRNAYKELDKMQAEENARRKAQKEADEIARKKEK